MAPPGQSGAVSIAAPSRVALAVGVCVGIMVLAAAGWAAWDAWKDAQENETARASLLAGVLEEQATRSIETVRVVLANLSELASERAEDGMTAELRAGMAQTLVSLPFLRSLAVVNTAGVVVAATSATDVGMLTELAGLAEGPDRAQGGIGPWLPGRNLSDLKAAAPGAPATAAARAGVGMIPYTLRFARKSASALELVAVINPDALLGFQQLALEGAGRTAILASWRGRVLALSGDAAAGRFAPGMDLSAHELFTTRLKTRNVGSYIGNGLDGGPGASVMAWQGSRTQPLVALVDMPTRELVAQWAQKMVPVAVMATGGLATVAFMTILAWRSLRLRERAQKKLASQLALTTLLLEVSPVPISMLDEAGRYVVVNKAWEDFMSRPRATVLGQHAARWLREDEDRLHSGYDRTLFERGGDVRYEARFTHPDGSVRDLLLQKAAVPDGHGRTGAVLCAIVDISEFREAERATREARDAAQNSLRAKTEFIANVSHELRTPLQAIIGFSELGMTRGGTPARMATMFGNVHASGERMLALVNDLLDTARIEDPMGAIELEPTELGGLVRTVTVELRPLLQRKELSVQPLFALPLMARVDAPRFMQVLRNVLANAIKFSPPGQPITITAGHADGMVEMRITDRGPGIPPAELGVIFDAFVQSSRTKDGSGGTGLGLAICRNIMRAHGGSISASNSAEGGACILVTIPAP